MGAPGGDLTMTGCCCGVTCNVIPRSLCGTTSNTCGWFPEYTDPEADPPVEVSCPPKFYRKKTYTYDYYTNQGVEACSELIISGNLVQTISIGKDEEGNCVETCEVTGSASSSFSCNDGTDTGSCTGTPIACYKDSWGDWVFYLEEEGDLCYRWGITQIGQMSFDEISRTPTSITYSLSLTPSGFPNWENIGTLTITLSDEVDLFGALAEKVCDTEACDSEEEEPGCDLCCTDRGGPISGERYLDTPEGCITPGSSAIAWDVSPCDTSGARAGQSVKLSLWFQDLVPGTTYKATITYKRCEFAKDEDDEYIVPSCSATGPCEEGPYSTLTDEIVFTATDWAEILSQNCGLCNILYKKCELEDEAIAWNAANPEEPERTVACTTGGFDIPTVANHYTWFHSCTTEVVAPEDP